jgi:hypothetical protein
VAGTGPAETILTNSHFVIFNGSTTGVTTINFTGSAAFSSATSYACSGFVTSTLPVTSGPHLEVSYTSGTQIIVTASQLPWRIMCVGN